MYEPGTYQICSTIQKLQFMEATLIILKAARICYYLYYVYVNIKYHYTLSEI